MVSITAQSIFNCAAESRVSIVRQWDVISIVTRPWQTGRICRPMRRGVISFNWYFTFSYFQRCRYIYLYLLWCLNSIFHFEINHRLKSWNQSKNMENEPFDCGYVIRVFAGIRNTFRFIDISSPPTPKC